MQPSALLQAAATIYALPSYQGIPMTPEIAVDVARRMARAIDADYASRGEFPMQPPGWPTRDTTSVAYDGYKGALTPLSDIAKMATDLGPPNLSTDFRKLREGVAAHGVADQEEDGA